MVGAGKLQIINDKMKYITDAYNPFINDILNMKPACPLRVEETIALPKIIVNTIVAIAVITNQITQ